MNTFSTARRAGLTASLLAATLVLSDVSGRASTRCRCPEHKAARRRLRGRDPDAERDYADPEFAGPCGRRDGWQRLEDRGPGLARAGHRVSHGDVDLPANSTAKIGQTSLLGSAHLELAPCRGGAEGPACRRRRDPARARGCVPDHRADLSSLSVVLNGGGLAQLQDITSELNKALDGLRIQCETCCRSWIPWSAVSTASATR